VRKSVLCGILFATIFLLSVHGQLQNLTGILPVKAQDTWIEISSNDNRALVAGDGFQPVQVVWQVNYSKPSLDDMNFKSYGSPELDVEWNATLPMVQGKNTSLFGMLMGSDTIRFRVVNFHVGVDENFRFKFTVSDLYSETEFKSDLYSVPAATKDPETGIVTPGTAIRQIPAPFPSKPFKFKNAGPARIEVTLDPPIHRNKFTVHVTVKDTQKLTIFYIPIVLFNGTTGVNLHNPVAPEMVEEHAKKATYFIKGAYPVAEDKIYSHRHLDPLRINFTEVRMTGVDFMNPPWSSKVNLTKIQEKLVDYAPTWFASGHVKVVGLVPDQNIDWPRTYDYNENATHIWHASWKGCTYIDQSKVVFVVAGWWGTTAHEIGHTFRLKKDLTGAWEEYSATYSGDKAPGYWVNERKIWPDTTICFMGNANPYRDFNTWICKPDYRYLLTKKFAKADPEVLLVKGLLSKNGACQIGNWYHLPNGVLDIALGTTGDFVIIFLNSTGQVLGQVGFNPEFLALGDEAKELNTTCFAFNVPYLVGTAKIRIVFNGSIVAERVVSDNAPVVTVTYPNGGEVLDPETLTTITWDAYDLNGDPLTYIVEYSMDGGETWAPLAVNLHATSYVWNTTGFPPGNKYLVMVMATDGVNVGEDISDGNFTIYLPVGGIWILPDKLGLLVPYIALVSTILVATAATAIYIKHVKHRKKKQ